MAEANYLIVNDNFEQALSDLNQVVLASRLRTGPQLARQHQLAKELGAVGGAN